MALVLDPRRHARSLAVLAAGGGVAAGLALQRAHVKRLAGDADRRRLSDFHHGLPLPVRSADGTRIHAEVFGPEEAATVVLAPGWTEQLSIWTSVITELRARGLRVVAYDLRGHGDSAPAAGDDYSLQRFGEDVEAVLQAALPDGRRATVVGHSLGGMAIAAWAERHDVREHACAAALVNTGFSDLIADSLVLPQLSRVFGEPVVRRLLLGSGARLPPFSSPLQHAMIRYAAFGPSATAGQVAFYEQMLVACPPHVRAACGLAISDMNIQDAVARLTLPTLVFAGDQDKLTPPSHARRIARALPQLERLIELPETGHMSPLERPAELSAALAEFVAKVTPDSRLSAA
jgi:pimeloyl-ACP methyl ester carboxylesterase